MTGGPAVNESFATSIPGVFAAGNVLHVHDLVDFVSEEAGNAGRHAVEYIREITSLRSRAEAGKDGGAAKAGADFGQEESVEEKCLPIRAEGAVRYTVPAMIRPEKMDGKLKIRFRVGSVIRNCYASLYLDGERILHRKRPVVAPGEMEELVLEKEKVLAHPEGKEIRVCIEME